MLGLFALLYYRHSKILIITIYFILIQCFKAILDLPLSKYSTAKHNLRYIYIYLKWQSKDTNNMLRKVITFMYIVHPNASLKSFHSLSLDLQLVRSQKLGPSNSVQGKPLCLSCAGLSLFLSFQAHLTLPSFLTTLALFSPLAFIYNLGCGGLKAGLGIRSFQKNVLFFPFFSVLYKRTFLSFPFFIKERSVLYVLFCSL